MSYPEGSGAARSMEEARTAPKITIVYSESVRKAWQTIQRLQDEIKADSERPATGYDEERSRHLHTLRYQLDLAKIDAYDVMRAYQVIEPLSSTQRPSLRDRIVEVLTDRGIFTYPPVAWGPRRKWAERLADAICER